LYGVLGIAPNADSARVKRAFRSLAKACHPDLQGGSDGRLKEISQAYATLVDPQRRAAYDAHCALVRANTRRRLAAAIATIGCLLHADRRLGRGGRRLAAGCLSVDPL
jgi:curved DNA-binding protein CbpA